jgi:ribonuclease D
MSSRQIRRYGRRLLQIIRHARRLPAPRPRKRNHRPPDEVLNRYDKLHNWRKMRGKKRGVESDVILSRDSLWELAHRNPQTVQELAEIDSIGNWRCQQYGYEIVALMQE